MESKNLLTLAIMLTVGIILAGSLLMPVLNEYGESEKTYINEGMPFNLADEETHSIVVSKTSTGYAVTSDGEPIALVSMGDFIPLIVADKGAIVLYNNDNVVLRKDGGSNATYGAVTNADVTITLTGTTASVGTNTNTLSNVNLFPAANGEYTLTNKAKITDATDLYTIVTGMLGATKVIIVGDATTGEYALGDTTNPIESIEVATSSVTTNLLAVDDFEVTAETGSITGTFVFAPSSVTYNNPDYLGDQNSSLLFAIPVLIIIGLVLMATQAVVASRR